jgi:hypothetical protein
MILAGMPGGLSFECGEAAVRQDCLRERVALPAILRASAMAFVLSGAMPFAANAATLAVPDEFTRIQAAIDAAESGDIVEVDIGTYRENLVLRSDISVRGIEAARTFLVAQDDSLPIVEATTVNNVLFANFTFIGSADGVSITDSRVTLASNVFDSLSGTAVTVGAGLLSDVEIVNNVFRNNEVGIDRLVSLASVTNNIFAQNTSSIISSGLGAVDPEFDVSYNCFFRNTNPVDRVDGALGTNVQTGDPLFVDVSERDFHLQEDSVCIDAGLGVDSIDGTAADMGAYGGAFADAIPYPVPEPVATDVSTTAPDVYNIKVDWQANLAYLVTNTAMPGSYLVGYQLNEPGPPYEGMDAGNGTEPSPISVASGTTYTLTDLQPGATATPGVPVLVSADPQNQSVVLNWNAATGASGYKVYYGINLVTENVIQVGNVTSTTVTGLTNGTEYVFAVGAIAQPVYYLAVAAVDSTADQNESDYSPEVSIAIGEAVEGMLSGQLTATPEQVVPYPDLPDKGCFVATAAFGADWVAEVRVLRDFRDHYLVTHEPGQAFVNWYYRYGPVAANYLDRYSGFKPLVRAALWPLVMLAAFMLGASALVKACVIFLLAVLFITLLRARRRKTRWARGGRVVQ